MGLCGSAEAHEPEAGGPAGGQSKNNNMQKDNQNINNSNNNNNRNQNEKTNNAQGQGNSSTTNQNGVASNHNNNNNNNTNTNANNKSNNNNVNPTSPASAGNGNGQGQGDRSAASTSSSSVDEVEFRDTAKLVVLLVLEKMVKALDYERDSLTALSSEVFGSPHPIALANGAAIEKFIRESYQIDDNSYTHINSSSSDNDEMSRFSLLITAAQQSEYRKPLPSVKSVATSLVNLAQSVRQSLSSASSKSNSSDIKLHLAFFSRALEFATKGDIINNPHLLFVNIDEVTNE